VQNIKDGKIIGTYFRVNVKKFTLEVINHRKTQIEKNCWRLILEEKGAQFALFFMQIKCRKANYGLPLK